MRLHKLTKPQATRSTRDDDLPSLDSHSEDEGPWSSDVSEGSEDEALSDVSAPSSSSIKLPAYGSRAKINDDDEMPYEKLPRKHAKQEGSDEEGISRLPIKSQDGKVHRFEKRAVVPQEGSGVSSDDEEVPSEEVPSRRDDVATGARFGRPAVVDVVSKKSRQARIQAAKEQIAGICQDIVGDPENSVREALF